jgi:hypothetical protein
MKKVKLFEEFLNESVAKPINDIKSGIYKGKIVRGFHGTINKTLVKNIPIHLGDREQVETRLDSIWGEADTLYEHEVVVKLFNPCPTVLMDVDKQVGHSTKDFLEYGNYNEFIYRNKSEGYYDQDDNLSMFIVDLSKCFVKSSIKEKYDTTE